MICYFISWSQPVEPVCSIYPGILTQYYVSLDNRFKKLWMHLKSDQYKPVFEWFTVYTEKQHQQNSNLFLWYINVCISVSVHLKYKLTVLNYEYLFCYWHTCTYVYTVCILMHDAILLVRLIINLQMYFFAFKVILYQ